MRRYYATNREKKVVYARRWYEANRERHAENARRWARANPEKMAESRRRWNVANREKVAERVRRRRARKAAVLTISFTTEQLAQRMAFWGNQCWMCGGPFEEVDHVIPIALGGPHCLSNLRPACKSCNSSKGARRLEGVA
jgi:5-methylcytosine-specific restriction endonuclease McrA